MAAAGQWLVCGRARQVTGRPNLAHAHRGRRKVDGSSLRAEPVPGAVQAEVTLRVDGRTHQPTIDTRTSLLDALRERVGNTSPKKGCDHGQCGACTVLLDRERVLSCLALAVAHDGAEVRRADGLTAGEALHPVQQAFIDHDAVQCGYCAPGQICSAVGMLQEAKRGWPSHVTADLAGDPELTDAEIAERMSGNLCRCGAYMNIVSAVRSAGGA
jgi:xanthine dehydrogenase YagT iron-sulfur-binding subunit